MILWYHQAEHGWMPNPLIHLDGKRFEKWTALEYAVPKGQIRKHETRSIERNL